MSTFDLTGDEHEAGNSASVRRKTDPSAGTGGAVGVLNLQRQAGNAAVTRAIQDGSIEPGTPLNVQRLEMQADDEEDIQEE